MPTQDTNHETAESGLKDLPFVSVLTIFENKHTYMIEPGSTLASVPDGGLTGFEDH